MKGFALVAVLLSAVAVEACGGGGTASSSAHGEGPTLAETAEAESHRVEKKEQAQASARRERREEKENREFREREEARIREEEAVRRKQRAKPKSAPAPEPVSSEVDPMAAEEFHQFSGVDRENWELAYEVCGSTPMKQLAGEFHTEDNWAAVGQAYGSEEFREPFNIAPEEGCMAALKDSKAQWEATLEALPFKEL